MSATTLPDFNENGDMIASDTDLEVTLDRIRWFQNQVAQLRRTETNAVNYRLASSGFLTEIDRMQLDVREYLASPPAQLTGSK